ncbi:MAG: DUF4307 domain-containing protein [Actinomycetota bacterium]|nr:DUF4307 domain-containing protein [Actinomycetota bacterium]
MTSQDALAERYGAPSPWRRRALVGGCVVVVAVFLGWLAWTAFVHSTPEVESELVSFDAVDAHTATARVSIDRRDDDVEATCLVRAFAEDHSVVGELSWSPDGEAREQDDVTIRTERLATSVELVGCITEDQSRPR